MTDFDHKDLSDSQTPKAAHGGVPLWIKVMWTLGIFWVVVYIIMGLRSSALTW